MNAQEGDGGDGSGGLITFDAHAESEAGNGSGSGPATIEKSSRASDESQDWSQTLTRTQRQVWENLRHVKLRRKTEDLLRACIDCSHQWQYDDEGEEIDLDQLWQHSGAFSLRMVGLRGKKPAKIRVTSHFTLPGHGSELLFCKIILF